eukprot:4065904-Amphidinium_carterae.1
MQFVPAVIRAGHGEGPLTQPLFELKFPYREDRALTAFVECTQFRQGPKFRFDREAHINRRELAAWLVGLRFALTHGGGRNERLFCLLDSAVCVNVIRRGRSSSHQLNRIMRRALTLQILHRFDVAHFPQSPTPLMMGQGMRGYEVHGPCRKRIKLYGRRPCLIPNGRIASLLCSGATEGCLHQRGASLIVRRNSRLPRRRTCPCSACPFVVRPASSSAAHHRREISTQ